MKTKEDVAGKKRCLRDADPARPLAFLRVCGNESFMSACVKNLSDPEFPPGPYLNCQPAIVQTLGVKHTVLYPEIEVDLRQTQLNGSGL